MVAAGSNGKWPRASQRACADAPQIFMSLKHIWNATATSLRQNMQIMANKGTYRCTNRALVLYDMHRSLFMIRTNLASKTSKSECSHCFKSESLTNHLSMNGLNQVEFQLCWQYWRSALYWQESRFTLCWVLNKNNFRRAPSCCARCGLSQRSRRKWRCMRNSCVECCDVCYWAHDD